jgi:hypothetical protein
MSDKCCKTCLGASAGSIGFVAKVSAIKPMVVVLNRPCFLKSSFVEKLGLVSEKVSRPNIVSSEYLTVLVTNELSQLLTYCRHCGTGVRILYVWFRFPKAPVVQSFLHSFSDMEMKYHRISQAVHTETY